MSKKVVKGGSNANAKKECVACGKEKPLTQYYISDSILYRKDGKANICKQCILEMIDESSNEKQLRSLKQILILLDKPFFFDLWISSQEDKTSSSPVRSYLKNVVMNQYRNYTYIDSVFEDPNIEKQKEREEFSKSVKFSEGSIKVDDETRLMFGYGYTDTEYIKMSKYVDDLHNSYRIETPTAHDAVVEIAKLSIDRDRMRENGDWSNYDKIAKTILSLQTSAALRPIDKQSSADASGITNFGMLFKRVEANGFAPPPDPKLTQDQIDEICLHMKNFTLSLLDREQLTEAGDDTPRAKE